MFIGVRVKGRIFDSITGRRFIHKSSEGSPGDPQNKFVMFFENVKESKKNIYSSLRGKSGVYMLINNITKDLYVGSSINLSKRMTSHFYHANSDKATKIVITRAMRKYKLENFSLGILEFCDSNRIICSRLEQN
jgi:predicted GIY-YIG superfamily endonuclease